MGRVSLLRKVMRKFGGPVLCALAASLMLSVGAQGAKADTYVHFDTNLGGFTVHLFDSVVPTTVANFLTYVNEGAYTNTMIHRTEPYTGPASIGIVQGGGYTSEAISIPAHAPIPLEYNLPNARGTISMARASDPNTATSQFFFNTSDNSDTLGPSNGGGYAVFGEVIGDGLNVLDAIDAVPTFPYALPFNEVPLLDFTMDDYDNGVDPGPHEVLINSVTVVPEPSTAVLASMAVVACGGYFVRRRTKLLFGQA